MPEVSKERYARERDGGGCMCVNERKKDERVYREGVFMDQRLHEPKRHVFQSLKVCKILKYNMGK